MIIGHHNSRSYDEVMTKLQRNCDDFMIIIIFRNYGHCCFSSLLIYMFTI